MGEWFAPGEFVLRSYDVGDGALMAPMNVESYEHFRPWMPWAMAEQSSDDAEVFARRFRAKYLLHEDFIMGVFRRMGGACWAACDDAVLKRLM